MRLSIILRIMEIDESVVHRDNGNGNDNDDDNDKHWWWQALSSKDQQQIYFTQIVDG